MRLSIARWAKHHALLCFFSLAFLISWSFSIPLALARAGLVSPAPPFAIHYLASIGPLLAAVIVTWVCDGPAGAKHLIAGLGRWRGSLRWLLVCVGAPIGLFALAVGWAYAENGRVPDLRLLGDVDYLPHLGIAGAVCLWLLTYGVGEEVGWRGFALPRLQRRHSALAASLLLSIAWAAWHLPAFFYRDTYMAMGLAAGFPTMFVSLAAAAIVFTWIFNSTHGSLLMVTIFHALFDLLSVSEAGGPAAAAIMSAAVMVAAVLIVLRYGTANLSRAAKQAA